MAYPWEMINSREVRPGFRYFSVRLAYSFTEPVCYAPELDPHVPRPGDGFSFRLRRRAASQVGMGAWKGSWTQRQVGRPGCAYLVAGEFQDQFGSRGDMRR